MMAEHCGQMARAQQRDMTTTGGWVRPRIATLGIAPGTCGVGLSDDGGPLRGDGESATTRNGNDRRMIMKRYIATLLGALVLLTSVVDLQAFYNPGTGRWINRDPVGEEGFYALAFASRLDFGPEDELDRLNPCAFVRNRPLDAFDAFGLQTMELCNPLCGPDVTKPLQGVVLRVGNTWNTWTPAQRKAACKGLTSRNPDPMRGGGPAWLNAWDIDMLFNKGWINAAPYCPPCATPQAQCRNTVQVGDQCYYAGSVNYVLFGHMANRCGWPKWKMTSIIWAYKGPKPPFSGGAPNYTTSRDWAIAGYDGWPAGSATPPPGDRPTCIPACPVDYSGPAFRFYWYPHGWN
jgi:hypothetical protein